MIVWISGPYGVGKSTLAEALAHRVPNAHIFDAEELGNGVRGNYPGLPCGVIYEDYPLWCEFCARLLADIHEKYHKNILVPMTLLRPSSYDSILRPLTEAGIDVRLLILEASYESVHDRILARGEDEDCWCMQNIEASRAGSAALPGIYLNTDGKTVEELAEMALGLLREDLP